MDKMEETSRFMGKINLVNEFYSLFQLNTELRLLVEKKWAEIELSFNLDKSKSEQGVTSFLLGKAFKTHGVIIYLCGEGYGEDAGILCRSLYELTVALLYINKEDSTRRAEMYMEYEYILKRNLYKDNSSILSRLNNVTQSDIEEYEKGAEEAIKKYSKSFKRNWSCKEFADMANEVGLGADYDSVYALFSDIAHSRITSGHEYVEENTTGIVINTGPSARLVEIVLVFSFSYFFQTICSWNKLFEFGLDTQLQALFDKFTIEMNRLKNLSYN